MGDGRAGLCGSDGPAGGGARRPLLNSVRSQCWGVRTMLASMNPLYEQMKTTVFERMSRAAASTGAVNIGQGFPDFGWSDDILDAAARAPKEGSNQYAP